MVRPPRREGLDVSLKAAWSRRQKGAPEAPILCSGASPPCRAAGGSRSSLPLLHRWGKEKGSLGAEGPCGREEASRTRILAPVTVSRGLEGSRTHALS